MGSFVLLGLLHRLAQRITSAQAWSFRQQFRIVVGEVAVSEPQHDIFRTGPDTTSNDLGSIPFSTVTFVVWSL